MTASWEHLVQPAAAVAGGVLLVALVLAFAARRRPRQPANRDRSTATTTVWLTAVGVAGALAVAVLSAIRSFHAVADRFGSPMVPLIADGMILATTGLRLAALSQGWRLPGAVLVTYVFVGGTVWLNIGAAKPGLDIVAHAIAPLSYSVLVEWLAHLLRRSLERLTEPGAAPPARRRLTALVWLVDPILTTRVWLHAARTGEDVTAARPLVQRLARIDSRLHAVCPGRLPGGAARRARAAALAAVREGLLEPSTLARLLPATTITAAELMALVDLAALHVPAPTQPDPAAGDAGGDQADPPVPADRPVPRTGPEPRKPPPDEPGELGTPAGLPHSRSTQARSCYHTVWLPLARQRQAGWPDGKSADVTRQFGAWLASSGFKVDSATRRRWFRDWAKFHEAAGDVPPAAPEPEPAPEAELAAV